MLKIKLVKICTDFKASLPVGFCVTWDSREGEMGVDMWGCVLFVVRGTFFKPFWNYGYNFHNLRHLQNYGCHFQGIFHNFRNYGADFHSICGIMALKSTRIYGLMGTYYF